MLVRTARRPRRHLLACAAASGFVILTGTAFLEPVAPAAAEDRDAMRAEIHRDIEATLGSVPGFVRQLPDAALRGAWQELKDLELSTDTALPPKVKALISLAVAAQIPCHYCVWADTRAAKAAGATEEEIAEAVAMAALTRHWSTLFNGLQVDFDQFRKDLGGEVTAAK